MSGCLVGRLASLLLFLLTSSIKYLLELKFEGFLTECRYGSKYPALHYYRTYHGAEFLAKFSQIIDVLRGDCRG